MSSRQREEVTDQQLEEAASRARASLESLVDSIGDWEPQRKGRRGKPVTTASAGPLRHWRDNALCRLAEGDWVGPTKARSVRLMREQRRKELAICDACSAKTECLEYGMGQPFGIFGGLLPVERKRLRRKK